MEGANAKSLAQQEEIKILQANNHESLAEQTVILNNRARFLKLKIMRNTGTSRRNNLFAYILAWLSKVLDLEKGVEVVLTQAYRIGRPNNPTRLLPRDIVITLSDIRVFLKKRF